MRHRIFTIILISAFVLVAEEPLDFLHIGTLQNPTLKEISGIESSSQSDSILWGITDSGNPAELYAFTITGQLTRTFKISNAYNTDWEDISAFRQNGQSFLIIADIGDNRAVRPECTLYIIKEPDLSDPNTNITPQQTIYYRYPDGPRDAEALAVDMSNQSILICSKRNVPPALYRLPLNLSDDSVHTAQKITELSNIPRSKESQSLLDRYQWQPTAMDIDVQAETLCILTYGNQLFYIRSGKESWKSAIQNPPLVSIIPLMQQAESLCFSLNEHQLFITTENTPAPLFRVQVP